MARKPERQDMRGEPALKMSNYQIPPDYSVLFYDYDLLVDEHRQRVQDAALDIRRHMRRTMEDVIEIGLRLIEVKDLFPHGEFERWVDAEFGMSRSLASEYRNVAERLFDKSTLNVHLTPTTARLLCAPSVPDEALEEAVEVAQEVGRPLAVRSVKAIIAGYKVRPLPADVVDEDEAIEADYSVLQQTIDQLGGSPLGAVEPVPVMITRPLAHKLRDALIHRLLKSFLSSEETDQLVVALTKALRP